MKHQTQRAIKEQHRRIAIANIKGLLKQEKVKEAIECAEIAGISPKEFGEIVRETNNINTTLKTQRL